jgi:transcriptional regulator with XRE-family HTH domain
MDAMDEAQKARTKKRFGARLRQLRKARKLSQEALALEAGLDRSYVGSIERGTSNVALINIHRIADALGVGAGELFGE